MTPQERQLIDDLFDRLAKLESAKRDPEAMSAIMQGLRNAPNAVYALVQTALVQDEALKRADMRIQELEAGAGQQGQGQPGGFLDSMRDAIFGQNQSHGSVPNVRAPEIAGGNRPAWNTGQVLQQGQPPGQYNQPAYAQPYGGAPQQPSAFGGGGGSFLGTAAAAAAVPWSPYRSAALQMPVPASRVVMRASLPVRRSREASRAPSGWQGATSGRGRRGCARRL